MALFLVQHGISAKQDIDPEKVLTNTGKADTKRIAQVAKGYKIKVASIVHSGKTRAKQTAAIYRDILSSESEIKEVAHINPLDDVRLFASDLHPKDDLMVVGHLPYLQRLVSFLTTGSDDILVYRFQNSGILCLDADLGDNGILDWYIKWSLNPNIS